MATKRKKKEQTGISIHGGVRGTGNVVGNESQSNVSLTGTGEAPSRRRGSSAQLVWSRAAAFLLALLGILVSVGLFIRLLDGFEPWLVVQLVLAALIVALGISGFLKPSLLVDLFGTLFGKK